MLTTIITAGGIGKRMGGDLPKQFLLLNGKPILQHTIEAFYNFDPEMQLLLTLPSDWLDYWKELCESTNFEFKHEIVSGGLERYHSIKKALERAQGDFIAVHDGVRPLIDAETIKRTLEEAKKTKAAIPAIPVTESVRRVHNGSSEAVNRKEYFRVQTPQIFEATLLKKAYEQTFHDGITDDASLVEELGATIAVVPGNERNIKITSAFDLKIAAL